MGKTTIKAWIGIWCLGGSYWAMGLLGVTPAQAADSSQSSSWTDSFTSGIKKLFKPAPPKPAASADDPTSLNSKAHVSPQTRLAMAKMFEDDGRYQQAIDQYKLALVESPKNVLILSNYGRLKAKMGDLEGATKLYEQAVSAAPKDAAVLNNLGMCFAQRKMYKEAVKAVQQSIQLQPNDALYHNNLAALLVEVGQPDAAFEQLRAVNPEAIAHYNLGALLKKKGDIPAAAQQFTIAGQLDPSLEQARYWANQLSPQPQPAVSAMPMANQQWAAQAAPAQPPALPPSYMPMANQQWAAQAAPAQPPAMPPTLPPSYTPISTASSINNCTMPAVAANPSWYSGQQGNGNPQGNQLPQSTFDTPVRR